MDLVKTGVPGFDDITQGGLRKKSATLLGGVPGTGKTIFGLHFLYFGAQKNESGLFISCDETAEEVYEYAETLGMDFKKYKDKLTILYQPITGKMFTFGDILDIIRKKKVVRVVLDSVGVFSYIKSDVTAYRKELAEFLKAIKESGVTFVATAEKNFEHIDHVEYHIEDFLFEGLILLSKIRKGASYERCVTVAKLRGQKHLLGIFPFSLDEKGIKIFPQEIPFSLIEKEG